MMKKVLAMKFNRDDGRKTTITVDEVRDDLLKEDVVAFMDHVVASGLLTYDEAIITSKDSAELVTTSIEEIAIN